MSRYIDAEILEGKIDEMQNRFLTNDDLLWDINKPYYAGLAMARGFLNDTPIADVQEVKHGEWDVKDLTPYCSICHRPSEYECDGVHSQPLFCPNCGAKMDG